MNACHAHPIEAAKPEPLADHLCNGLDRMVEIQMEAYPADWSEAEKREMAERHLFGRAGS